MIYRRLALVLVATALLAGCGNVREPEAGVTATATMVATVAPTVVVPAPSVTPALTPTPTPPPTVLIEVATGNVVPSLPIGIAIADREPRSGQPRPPRPAANRSDYSPDAMMIEVSRNGNAAIVVQGTIGGVMSVVYRDIAMRTDTVIGPIPICFCDGPNNFGPFWSPSDQYVVFVEGHRTMPNQPGSPAPSRPIVIIEVASGLTRRLDPGSSLATTYFLRGTLWHPTRDLLAYSINGEARMYDAATNRSITVGRGRSATFWNDELFAHQSTNAAAAGLALRDINRNTDLGPWPWLTDTQFRYANGVLTLAGLGSTGACGGVIAQHAGGSVRCLVGAKQPTWSPDGRTLAVMQPDGSNLRAVTLVDGAAGQQRILARGLPIPNEQCWDYEINWSTNNAFIRLTPAIVYCGGI